MNNNHIQLSDILILLVAFLLYSCTSVFMKLASFEDILSYKFYLFYIIAIIILGFYAVLWQISLKRVPLTIAFMTKSSTVIFTMLIAHFVFQENISINNFIGAGFVVLGIILLPFKK